MSRTAVGPVSPIKSHRTYRTHGPYRTNRNAAGGFACFSAAIALNIIQTPSQVPFVALRERMARAYRTWWIGIALASAAGLSIAAPRANASCAAPHFSFALPPLPFGDGGDKVETPKAAEPKSAPCPCKGPHCHKTPSDSPPPPSNPPRSTFGHDWAWLGAPASPPRGVGADWARAAGLRPLLSPLCPPERPPRQS